MNRDIIIGKYTLESLTNGMYADPLDLYREYIQNAVDSIDSAQSFINDKKNGFQIKVQIDKLSGTIEIKDNGEGIKSDVAVRTLVDIGNSEKDKRKTRGFRGIGRLAGLGYSERLSFSTSYFGEAKKTIITFDTSLLKKLLFSNDEEIVSINDVMKRIVTIERGDEEAHAHYFEVELEGVPLKEKLLDEKVVESYLIQHAPVPYKEQFLWGNTIKEKCKRLGVEIREYHIELNEKQLFKPYENTFFSDRVKKREDRICDIDVKPFYRDEKLTAVLWYGVSEFYGTILDNQIKGIRIRQGNLLIGDKSTCNILFKEERFNGWIVGELHVIDSDLIVNARRDYFEQNESYYDLSETFKKWSATISKDIRKISYERCLSEKKLTVIEAGELQDTNKLCVEDMSYGESSFIDREEGEEVSEIDFMSKLSWILKQKQGKTKYLALNMNSNLTLEQKKILERTFDIVIQQYRKKEAEKFINTIVNNI